MTSLKSVRVAGLAGAVLIACALAPVRAQQTAIVDIRSDRQTWIQERDAAHAARRGTPNDTQAEHIRVDDDAVETAKKLDGARQKQLDAIFNEAKTRPAMTGTDPLGPDGRGIAGDIDHASVSDREFQRLMKAAKDRGYTLVRSGDSFTIEELDAVFHRQKSGAFAPAGSSAAETAAIGRASNPETGLAFEGAGQGDPYLKVLDNTRKGGDILQKDSLGYTYDDWTKAGKMVGRNMDAAEIQDPTVRRQLDDLKRGRAPESAGIVPDHATPEQRSRAIREFQQRIDQINTKAYSSARTRGLAKEAQLAKEVQQAKTPAERVEARAKQLDYRNEVLGAKTNINRDHGGHVLSTLEGDVQTRRVLDDGTVVNVDAKTRASRPPSQTTQRVAKPARTSVIESVRPPATSPAPPKSTQLGGAFLFVAGAIMGGLEGAERAKAERAPNDGFLKSWGKGIVYGLWYTSGIPGAAGLIDQTSKDGLDEYYTSIAQGGDPSAAMATAAVKSGGLLAYRLTVEPAVLLATSGSANATEWEAAEEARMSQEIAESDQADRALVIARSHAAEIEKLAAGIAARTKALDKLVAGAEALRAQATEGRRAIAAARDAYAAVCAEAGKLPAAVAGDTVQSSEAAQAAQFKQASTLADGACAVATRTVADYQSKAITAEGVSFRLENSVARPLAQAADLIARANQQLDAGWQATRRSRDVQTRAQKAGYEHQTVIARVDAVEVEVRAAGAVLAQELTALDASATRFDRVRAAFDAGVRRFDRVVPADATRDTAFRALAGRVSALSIDRGRLARLRDAATALRSLGTQRVTDDAARRLPPCESLASLERTADVQALRTQVQIELAQDAARRVALGVACRDRLASLVPGVPPVTPPPPRSLPVEPPPPVTIPPPRAPAAEAGPCAGYSVADLRKIWTDLQQELKEPGTGGTVWNPINKDGAVKTKDGADKTKAGPSDQCLLGCDVLWGVRPSGAGGPPTEAELQACISGKADAGSPTTPKVPDAKPPVKPPPPPPQTVRLDPARAKALEEIAGKDPKNVQARVELGNMTFDAEQYPQAIKWYEQVLALTPNNVNVSTDLGVAYYYTNQHDRALAQFDRSLAVDPKNIKTLLNLGIVHAFGKQDLAGAERAWQRVVELAPNSSEAQAARKGLEGIKATRK